MRGLAFLTCFRETESIGAISCKEFSGLSIGVMGMALVEGKHIQEPVIQSSCQGSCER